MRSADKGQRGPVLLCYDGSDGARWAIEHAGRVLGGAEGVVLTVWESLGSAILRHVPSGETEFGSDARGIAEDVVSELDASTTEQARRRPPRAWPSLPPLGSTRVRWLAVPWPRPPSATR
jgi:hypothetical protein